MHVMDEDLIRSIRLHHRHFFHYHTAGVPGRGPLDDHQKICYRKVFQAIASTGFTGTIGHEFIPRNNLLGELQDAWHLCRAHASKLPPGPENLDPTEEKG